MFRIVHAAYQSAGVNLYGSGYLVESLSPPRRSSNLYALWSVDVMCEILMYDVSILGYFVGGLSVLPLLLRGSVRLTSHADLRGVQGDSRPLHTSRAAVLSVRTLQLILPSLALLKLAATTNHHQQYIILYFSRNRSGTNRAGNATWPSRR